MVSPESEVHDFRGGIEYGVPGIHARPESSPERDRMESKKRTVAQLAGGQPD